jgi:hypothetical protein
MRLYYCFDAVQVSPLTIDTKAGPPELTEAFVVARSGPCDSWRGTLPQDTQCAAWATW